MSNNVSRRAALEMAAASAAYFALPNLPFELEASAASKRSRRILQDIRKYRLGMVKKWKGEKPAYGFGVILPPDALPIISDYNSKYGVRGRRRKVIHEKGFKNRGVHWGIDIGGPFGTPVLASHDGTIKHRNDRYAGRALKLETSLGSSTEYWHLKDRFVKQGVEVKRGQIIGSIGKSGNWGGATHVHMKYVDPYEGGTACPHRFWYGQEDLAVEVLGGGITTKKVMIPLFRPGSRFETDFGETQILTYPVPGANDMPHFLDKLEAMKRKR